MELFSTEFFSALLAIVIIDLVLAGDNAIVIALAARNVPKHLQQRAILWGTAGAIVVRSALTIVVVWLLKVPGLMLAGGAMLVWIAYRLLLPADGGGGHEVSSADNFWGAMKTIVVADALMGLDNVLAVAGAAHGSFVLVVLGLLISIPIVIWGSQLILKWVDRYPSIVYFGAGVLAWTAAKMMLGEPLLKNALAGNALIAPLVYFAVIASVLWYGWRGNHRRIEARIAVQLEARAGSATNRGSTVDEGGHAMKRVLLPVDGSANSLKAVRHVISRCATDWSIELHLLHVCTPFSRDIARFVSRRDIAGYQRNTAARALKAARQLLDARGIPYTTHVECGERAETISAVARRIRSDQLVIGTARKNSFTRMIEDSVTNKVLEQTQVPVEIIAGETAGRIERIGVPAGVGVLLAALLLALD